uniref:Bis(5'-adenosyl)-triphosphatase enpp4 n=1 Tax=Sphaerodactylus townsendi TaxID=933632 RepID=A0ACB8GEI4_9SAUR
MRWFDGYSSSEYDMADGGRDFSSSGEEDRQKQGVVGDHGYDNAFPSMHPFLAAHGPAFRKGYWRKTMNTVDIYPMMCHILGLTPQPNNGTLSNSKCLLADQWCINIPEAIGIVIGVLMVLTTLTCLIIIMKNRTPSLRPFSRLQLQEDDDDPLIG